jgi:ubiquinone/menaquinone biosynthesis C-methylase UbiE
MATFVTSDPAGYETFMGRWTSRLAGPFLDFVRIGPEQRVLDVGCGTGVVTAAAAERGAITVGLDPSEAYLEYARGKRSGPNTKFELGDARRIGYSDASFDAVISTLALDLIPDTETVGNEMCRVTRSGGTVASAVHDFRGAFSPMFIVCDIASVLDSRAQSLRDEMLSHPLVWPQGQAKLWQAVGLKDVSEVPIVVPFDYSSFADYWATFESGQGRVGGYVMSLPEEHRRELQRHVQVAYLAGMPDGPRSFSVIIRAAKGYVPWLGWHMR